MGIQGRDYMRERSLPWDGGDGPGGARPPGKRNLLPLVLAAVLIVGVLVLLLLPAR